MHAPVYVLITKPLSDIETLTVPWTEPLATRDCFFGMCNQLSPLLFITSDGAGMRILVTSILDIQRSAPSRLHHLLRKLSQRHDVTVLSPYDSWKEKRGGTREYDGNFPETLDRVTQVYLPLRKASPALQDLASPFFFRTIDRLTKKTDVHLNYNSVLTGWLTTAVAGRNKKPTIMDIADDVPAMILESEQIPRTLRRLSSMAGRRLLELTMVSAKRICYSSESLASSLGIPKDKARLLPNGVDTESFSENIQFEEWLANGPRLIYVGVVREWVDLDSVAIALSALRKDFSKARLTLIGGEASTDNLSSFLLRNRELVTYMGALSHREIPGAINDAAIGVIPFRKSQIAQGAFPLKALEYAACGRPVVTSSLPELKRIFGETFYYADNPIEIEASVRSIVSNPDEARRKATEARDIIVKHYQWDSVIREYENELTTLVE